MIRVHYAGQVYAVPVTVFRGGEVNIVLPPALRGALKDHASPTNEVRLVANVTNSNTLVAIALTTSAIRRMVAGIQKIDLVLPYLPYGRQDRVCHPGEDFSLKTVMMNLVNSMGFRTIYTFDAHSSVATETVHNLVDLPFPHYPEVVANLELWMTMTGQNGGDIVLVAPDRGARDRVKAVASLLNLPYVVCEKTRTKTDTTKDDIVVAINSDNGEADIKGKHVLVIDDICDGGRTFLALSKALDDAGAQSTHLFVTHGIFSYGNSELCNTFDTVHCSNSFDGGLDLPVENRVVPLTREPNFHVYPLLFHKPEMMALLDSRRRLI